MPLYNSNKVPLFQDWTSYTVTANGLGTITSAFGQWRRVGANMEVIISFTSGTTVATQVQIFLPQTVDTSKLLGTIPAVVGEAIYGSAAAIELCPIIVSGVTNYFCLGLQASGTAATTPVNGTSLGSSVGMAFHVSIPVSGWTSFT
ncbi:MAG: hypothetical protein NVS1B10_06700 [Candidatus Saccharimonadales bacterium]